MSARLKPYPSYMDSGVPWLGRIPAHWQVKRTKYVALISDEKLAEKPAHLAYLGLENVESKTGRLLLEAPVEFVDSTVVRFHRGDVLFGKLRPYLAKAVLADFDGVATSELLVLRPTTELAGKFFVYRLLSPDFIELVNSFTYGAKMPRASSDQVGNVAIGVPPVGEQAAIGSFLDLETEKIDRLVKKEERLIELLQEKRTALISHAVTQGLNPNAPKKDSGIPWLGYIPTHWQVKRTKYISLVSDEKLARKPADLEYLGLENVESETGRLLLEAPVEFVDSSVVRFRRGDVLFGKLRPYLAKVLLADFDGVATTELLVLRPTTELEGKFLAYRLLSPDFIELVNSLTYGAKMPRASSDQVGDVAIGVPPVGEQAAIAEFLDRETAKLDALIGKVRDGIERLQEYRAALISAAVTGRIDVRNHATAVGN